MSDNTAYNLMQGDTRKVQHWWRTLQPDQSRSNPAARAGNRAALARLRRCHSIADAGVEPEALLLGRALGVTSLRAGWQAVKLERALLTAIVLAHVREDDELPVARRLGAPAPGERAAFSPMRLARLLAAETSEEQLTAFRRVVAMLGGRANVRDLAAALLNWSQSTRIAWAFNYHGASPPRAEPDPNETMSAGVPA